MNLNSRSLTGLFLIILSYTVLFNLSGTVWVRSIIVVAAFINAYVLLSKNSNIAAIQKLSPAAKLEIMVYIKKNQDSKAAKIIQTEAGVGQVQAFSIVSDFRRHL